MKELCFHIRGIVHTEKDLHEVENLLRTVVEDAIEGEPLYEVAETTVERIEGKNDRD